jgi:universal stress protein E
VHSIGQILVAVKDPGARSLPAVNKATQLARALGAQLELFHVIDSAYLDMLGLGADRTRRPECDERSEYLQRLERVAARARLHGATVTVAAERDYPAYEAIVRRALEIGADLIVAECHARRRVTPALLRLADWELLRASPLPVLLVKGARLYHHPTLLMALDPGHAHHKPAQLDEEIVEAASTIAAGLKGKLHAVHAYLPATAATRAGAGLERALRSTTVGPECRHLVAGDPARAVRDTARRLGADIVVAGAISRSALGRLLIGHTAERLLDHLACDLLIVKPAEFKCPVPREASGPRLLAVEPLG